ncbi:sigma factor-like helix-turn-helix DNA-binding protein [Mycolicibacterium pyrenivorans]|uniref:sigma factor-like helix-turn-helix DNA-binding protein n=1 Tax=Mycolicibacterium pyrenivorans TaxID=187102 RepID=UPI0035571066
MDQAFGSPESRSGVRSPDRHPVVDANGALPEAFRVAVYDADLEGRTDGEIAAMTEVPIGTVMSRVFRGRRQLRRALSTVARDRGYSLREAA